MKTHIPLGSIWQSFENGLLYKVLMLADGEVIASTRIRNTTAAADSFSWLSAAPEFLNHFKPVDPQHFK